MTAPEDPDDVPVQVQGLGFLKALVTVLTVVMIAGLVILIVLIVLRVNRSGAEFPLPENFDLPDGVAARAVTVTDAEVLVVSEDGRLFVYDRRTGALAKTVSLTD